MLARILMMAVALGALAGCASSPYTPLSDENAQKIQSVGVRSEVLQDEVVARADPSTVSLYMGGGLIPALIDSSVTRGRQDQLQEAMRPLYESLADYDFRAEFWPRLTQQLQSQFPLKVVDVFTTPRISTFVEDQRTADGLEDGKVYMTMATSYFLSPDLRTLVMSTAADIQAKGQTKPIYQNAVFYRSATIGTGGKDSAQRWAADSGKLFHDTANEGVREMLDMLAADIKVRATSAPRADAEQITVTTKTADGKPDGSLPLKGTVVEKQGDRVVLRTQVGFLYSVLP